MSYLLNLSFEEQVFFVKAMEKAIEDRALYDKAKIEAGGGEY